MRICVFGLFIAASFCQAQTQAEFEVASVKPNHLDDHIVTVDVGPGDRFTARGYTLALLIQRAWGVMRWRVTGGPDWIRSDRFDVVAKAGTPGNLTEEQLQPRLQSLLAERFKLKLHEAPRQMIGYTLTTTRQGPKMKAASGPEPPFETLRLGYLRGRGLELALPTFAKILGGILDVPVEDDTGLKGVWVFKVAWTEEFDPNRGLPGTADTSRAAEPGGSTVFTAVEDQLGLKLAPRRITADALVIDSAEQPSEN
jgi:uncharacterized protein (TIGR03435 family)